MKKNKDITTLMSSNNMNEICEINIHFYISLSCLMNYLDKYVSSKERKREIRSLISLIDKEISMDHLIEKSIWRRYSFAKNHEPMCFLLFDIWMDSFDSIEEVRDVLRLLNSDLRDILNDTL